MTLGMSARPSAELDLFRQLLTSRAGISFTSSRETFLEGRLRRRMTQVGARSLYEYYRMVTSPGTGAHELQALVDDVAVNETAFFRNASHFEFLGRTALPQLLRERQASKRLRIWSAGSSTGQEAYSTAMVFLETALFHESWDLSLVGTDISARAVERAGIGEYDGGQLEGVSAARRQRFFERVGMERYSVRRWVRRGLEFVRGNVLDGPPWKEVDVVFCRNVMIYFDAAHQRRLARSLADALTPGGYLFLGHTESLRGLSDAFRMVSLRPGIAYQRT